MYFLQKINKHFDEILMLLLIKNFHAFEAFLDIYDLLQVLKEIVLQVEKCTSVAGFLRYSCCCNCAAGSD